LLGGSGGLTDANAGSYFDHETQRVKRVYRDVSPKTFEALVRVLKHAFGPAGVQLADLDERAAKRRAEKQKAGREALTAALEELG
jgi:hypothetical protein